MVHYFTKVGAGEYYLEELEETVCEMEARSVFIPIHSTNLDSESPPNAEPNQISFSAERWRSSRRRAAAAAWVAATLTTTRATLTTTTTTKNTTET